MIDQDHPSWFGWLIAICMFACLASSVTAFTAPGQPQPTTALQWFQFTSPLHLYSNGIVTCPTCSTGGGGGTYTGNNPITISPTNVISFNSLWLPSNTPYTAGNNIAISPSNVLSVYPSGINGSIQFADNNALGGTSSFTYNSAWLSSGTNFYDGLDIGDMQFIGSENYGAGCSPFPVTPCANIITFFTANVPLFAYFPLGEEFYATSNGVYFLSGQSELNMPVSTGNIVLAPSGSYPYGATMINNSKGAMITVLQSCGNLNTCKGGSVILGNNQRTNVTIIDAKNVGNPGQINLTDVGTLQVNGAGNDGLSETVTVQNSLVSTCTMVFTIGILTGGTCT